MWDVTEVRKKVTATLSQVEAGRLIVGCSNGPDSLVLADAVLATRAADTTLVYVDHGLRPDTPEEGRAVLAFAAAHGGSGRVVSVRVERAGRGLEDAARQARHAALEAVADEVGARWILLGHTASDQAETVLARLLRGAGPVGLAGIPPVRGRIRRPLLDLPRGVIDAYVAERGLTPSRDPMNDDRAFLRTRVRHELLPLLRRENPRVDEALDRAARSLREVAEALDWAAAHADIALGPGPRLSAVGLCALPPAIAKRLLARRMGGLEARHLDAVLALAAAPAEGSATLHLPGLVVRREYGELVLGASPAREVSAEVVDGTPPDGPYRVREWQAGDRMRPAGLGGHSRKLSDLFIDRKVPAAERVCAIVIVRERDGAIVWAEHVGPAFEARLQVALTRRDSPVI